MKTKSNDHTQSMDTSLDINRSKEQNVKKIDNPYQVITQQQKGINLCVLNYLVSSYLTQLLIEILIKITVKSKKH